MSDRGPLEPIEPGATDRDLVAAPADADETTPTDSELDAWAGRAQLAGLLVGLVVILSDGAIITQALQFHDPRRSAFDQMAAFLTQPVFMFGYLVAVALAQAGRVRVRRPSGTTALALGGALSVAHVLLAVVNIAVNTSRTSSSYFSGTIPSVVIGSVATIMLAVTILTFAVIGLREPAR